MGKQAKLSSPFEQSFMFHMIQDFFLLLLLVATVEMGIRYAVLRFDFANKEQTRVEQAAQQLANDVKSIMLNSGGPLAAQTVYPILNRNYDDLGLSIAVIPSDVTVESMKQSFKIDVKGLQPTWRVGEHLEASVNLTAEQFCLGCHVKAKVGDVLGTVKVGSYLERKELAWWTDVKLTAGALSLKILVHTILLFFLLKVRMAPLLALRSTVSELARGVMDLSPRAKVNGADEFGELAQDLNHFLDRITVVVTDLDKILSEVVAVGERLGTLNRDLEQKVDVMRDSASRVLGGDAQRSLESQLLVARESGAFAALDQMLDQTLAALGESEPGSGRVPGQVPGASSAELRDHLARLRNSFATVAASLKDVAPPVLVAQAQSLEYQAFARSLREMAVLEAAMQNIAQSGQQVLHRLTHAKK
jgi:HAMP domain-containing protein